MHEARALSETRTLRQRPSRPDGAFVQMRQEFRTDDSTEAQIPRNRQRGEPDSDRYPTMLDRPSQPPAVALRYERHHRIAPFSHTLAKERARKDRGDEDRKRHRTEQGERDGPGHRPEQPPLDSLQSENRQIGRDDDRDGVKHGPLHL